MKHKIDTRLPWKYRWDISNERCSPESWKELLNMLRRLKAKHVVRFKVSVWRNPPDKKNWK